MSKNLIVRHILFGNTIKSNNFLVLDMTPHSGTMRSLLLATILLTAITPLTSVQAQPDEASNFFYGVEYDWTSLDTDLENFTGMYLPEIFAEVMGAADDAGLGLALGQLTTGSSNVYVHYSEDISPQTITDIDGNDISVWSRTNDVTLRHGVINDALFSTDWSEEKFGKDATSFDIDVNTDAEQVLTVDMIYKEYLNEDYELVGADMDFAMEISTSGSLSIEALFEGGGETLPIDFDTSFSTSYSITDSDSEWRLGEPSTLFIEVSDSDYVDWSCNQGEDDWYYYDEMLIDDCGVMDGTYSSALTYDFSVAGIPTEEFGLDAGELDLSISDNFQQSNSYEWEPEMDFTFSKEQDMTVDLGDGSGMTTAVSACTDCPPGSPTMFGMMANVIAGVSLDFGEAISEDVMEGFDDTVVGEWFDSWDENNDGEEDNRFVCDSGDTIPQRYVNDGWEDCNDGSDEMDIYSISFEKYAYDEMTDESNIWIAGGARVSNDLLDFDTDTLYFVCQDGEEVPFNYVNDEYADCTDGTDEPDGDRTFTCDDGETIPLDYVNDGDIDCQKAEDEGATNFYVLDIAMTDGDKTLVGTGSATLCDTSVCDAQPSLWNDYTDFGVSITQQSDVYGETEYCVSGSFEAANGDTISLDSSCEVHTTGPEMGSMYTQVDGMSIEMEAYVYNTYGHSDVVMTAEVFDASNNEVYTNMMIIDDQEYSMEYYDTLDLSEEGEYCITIKLTQVDSSAPYSEETSCEDVSMEGEPSDRLMAIAEAFEDSGIEEVMNDFGENLEDRLESYLDGLDAFEFPYDDGMFAPLWSNEHATIVGVGVYVEDLDGDWHTLVGPQTQGYSNDAPAKVSLRYLTGTAAETAADEMEGASTLADLVDAEDHDVTQIVEDLEEAGIDTSGMNIPEDESNTEEVAQTAEELAEDAGLLPFLSPLTVFMLIGMAAIIAGRREEDNE